MGRPLAVLAVLAVVSYGGCSCPGTAPTAVEDLRIAPSTWTADERTHYAALTHTFGEAKGACATGPAMIVSTSGATAVHAGWRVLDAGGSAADAAIATALAQIVLNAGSWDSLAGMLYALVYDAETGEVHALNAGFDLPREETDPASIPRAPEPSGRTALIGGFGAGIEALHERYGRTPWAALFDPAIELAEDGFAVYPFLARILEARKEILGRSAAGRAIFFKPDGSAWVANEVFRQPQLAATLAAVARHGASYLYTGPWARRFVDVVRRAGGKVVAADLAEYRARWQQPLGTTYRGHPVFTLGHPELGAVQLLEGLNLLELADLPRDVHWSASPDALYRLIQIDRLAYAITYAAPYRPFPADDQPVPWIAPELRIGKDHAARLHEAMRNPGWEAELTTRLAATNPAASAAHSDAIVAVDARGNVVVVVHSINTSLWGSTGLFVDGVSVPDPASFQQAMLAKAGPGRRLPNIVNPAIVLREGRPLLASAAIGNALNEAMLEHIVDVVDHGMTPAESFEAPRFWGPWWGGAPAEYAAQAIEGERFAPEVVAAVEALGQPLRELPAPSPGSRVGYWAGIRFGDDGERCGAVSPNFNGLVHVAPR